MNAEEKVVVVGVARVGWVDWGGGGWVDWGGGGGWIGGGGGWVEFDE